MPGIERVTTRLNGREEWMIPILMALFAAGGTIYGMAEESLPFYTLLVPVMMAARFDPLVAAATVLLGSALARWAQPLTHLLPSLLPTPQGSPLLRAFCCVLFCC